MHHGVTFNFGTAKVCSPAIFETCFSYNKDIWIAATDYYVHFYIIVLFPLTAILPLNYIAALLYVLLHNYANPIDNCSHGVKSYFPRLWGTDISDAIFVFSCTL